MNMNQRKIDIRYFILYKLDFRFRFVIILEFIIKCKCYYCKIDKQIHKKFINIFNFIVVTFQTVDYQPNLFIKKQVYIYY